MKESKQLTAGIGMMVVSVLVILVAVVVILISKSDEPEIGHRSHAIGELE